MTDNPASVPFVPDFLDIGDGDEVAVRGSRNQARKVISGECGVDYVDVPRVVMIEPDPSWADEHMDCYSCGYPIFDWEDVVAIPAGVIEDDPPTMAALIHRECPK